jgi:flagellar basal-body rod protein FlgG
MYNGIYATLSGSVVQEQRLAVLTNNLANASTAGFKADRPVFHVAPLPVVVGPVSLPTSAQPVLTTLDRFLGKDSTQNRLVEVYTDFTQGSIRDSGNPLDLALEGEGFFVVETPHGLAYTRQGTFSLNAEGLLVTADGFSVQGERGPINIRGAKIEVDASGQILVDGRVVDRLKLIHFPRPYPLEKVGNTLFRSSLPTPPEEAATGLIVHQGAIELSNSEPIKQMVSVIETVRAYEAYQKALQAFDEITTRAVNDIART